MRLKFVVTVCWAAVAALYLCGWSTFAGQVDKLVCKRVSGGPMTSFHMTIDFDAKDIDVPSGTGLQPDPDSVEITNISAKWSFMRGFVDFDRRILEERAVGARALRARKCGQALRPPIGQQQGHHDTPTCYKP